jgi:sialate O-acetylesterase
MVLQRAPASAMIWGFAAAGSSVNTTLDTAAPLTAVADSNGTWRQKLPPTTSGAAHTITVRSSESGVAPVVLEDVAFGEVYLCGGELRIEFNFL